MVERSRLSLQFDPVLLREDLNRVEDSEWIEHFNPRDYEGNWSVAPLRQPAAALHPIQTIYSDPKREGYIDSPLLARCPYFASVLQSFECSLNSARLMRLHAGAIIKEHTDSDLAFEEGEARIHIPVMTNPDVGFYLKGEQVDMKEGETWYLNFSLPHRVDNFGTTDRVHLVIDCLVNEWVQDLVLAGS